MTRWVWLTGGVLAVLLVVSMAGCFPSGQSQMEEEKEPHFIAGKSCINSMDYKGAIAEFEKALELNPRNASAHFQLGWLYTERDADPAAAVYHYEKFLKLRPDAYNADVVKGLINNCKQDLAKTVFPLQATPSVQHDIERLVEENRRLRDENAYYVSRLQVLTNTPGTTVSSTPIPTPTASTTPRSSPASGASTTSNGAMAAATTTPPSAATRPTATGSRTATAMRTHTVQSGESPYSIARKYGIKLDALLAANPGLDPTRLRPGQTLRIPSS